MQDVKAGGLIAISRRLAQATPPVNDSKSNRSTQKGVPAPEHQDATESLGISAFFRGSGLIALIPKSYRPHLLSPLQYTQSGSKNMFQ